MTLLLCCQPEWARECLQKFEVAEGVSLGDVVTPHSLVLHRDSRQPAQVTIHEIYKGSKKNHLTKIAKEVGCQLEEMIFLDNERGNCKTVAAIGCTVGYTPEGVTRAAWDATLAAFPAPGRIVGGS